MKVVLVSASARERVRITRDLADEGVECEAVGTLADALPQADDPAVVLVLLDAVAPGPAAWPAEAVQRLRGPKGDRPVVALSDNPPDEWERLKALGCSGVASRHVDREWFLQTISEALAHREILLIEDDPKLAGALMDALSDEWMVVASRAELEALTDLVQHSAQRPFAAVLVGRALAGELSGFALLHLLRRSSDILDTAAVIIVSTEPKAQFRRAGETYDGYLHVMLPLDRAAVAGQVRNWIDAREVVHGAA